ncbi:hypothetical protein O6H91_05G000500 [Diphasiastrum complanatum]|uniref:Uncharacterized protein n=1 Tax=Diphasiastrum complanatum TaxID=34168 RepID=A0ACC2DKP7_DIPCM|nr:hypothetical protein O6H91_05G000500 [Diphasiastrum complanatum]
MSNQEAFITYFQKADSDGDGRISGAEAVAFFRGANLPQVTLAKIWQFSDQAQRGFLLREDFSNALKLITVAQSGKELTPEIVRAALTGSASSQIPLPRIAFAPAVPQPAAYGNPPQASASIYSTQQLRAGQAPASQYRPHIPKQTLPPVQNLLRPGQQPSTSDFAVSSWEPFNAVNGAPGAPSFRSEVATQNPQPRPSAGTSTQGLRAAFEGPGFQAPTQIPSLKNSSVQGSNLAPSLVTGSTLSAAAAGGLLNLSSGSNTGSSKPQTAATAKQQLLPFSSEQRAPFVGSQGLRPLQGSGFGEPWPKMTQFDAHRYTKIFVEVDSDRDGKISGDQARGLFSSWQLPREILKQIWDLSDQDGDYMLSLREFCTALFLMERHREGRPLPAVLPAGFHFEDQVRMQSVSAARIAEAQAAVAQHSAGLNVPAWQQNPIFGLLGLLQPYGSGPSPTGGRPPIDRKSQPNKFMGENGFGSSHQSQVGSNIHQLYGEKDLVKGAQTNANGDQVQELEKSIMSSKEKLEFYRSKLQEIVLFKSRCDNRLTEFTERATADKREVESLAKKYDEKFKLTAELNSRLVAEEAALRDIQGRKSELLSAITQIAQGGNANALLQTRANRIFSDLDELWKALDVRAKHLGIQVEAFDPTEPPFGWQPRIQETATEWEEEWDELDEEGFIPIAGMTDETDDSSVHNSKAKAVNPSENGLNVDKSASSHESNLQHSAATDESPASKPRAEFPTVESDALPVRGDAETPRSDSSQTAKTNISDSMTTGLSDNHSLFEDTPNDAMHSWAIPSNEALHYHASDVQTSLRPTVDPPSTQISSSSTDNGLSKGEIDLFADFSSKKEEIPAGNLFNTATSVPEAPLFSIASPTKSSGLMSVADDARQSSHVRFDSITSFGGNRARALGSFDDSDLFTSTGPFGFNGENPKASSRWSSLN